MWTGVTPISCFLQVLEQDGGCNAAFVPRIEPLHRLPYSKGSHPTPLHLVEADLFLQPTSFGTSLCIKAKESSALNTGSGSATFAMAA